jgi:hypothetical protein
VAGNELGYMGLDKRGAERLFQVPTEREEKTAAAIASNDSFSAWTKTFTDPRLCAAIVDRLTFGGNIIETGTRVVDRSVRCQHAIDPTLRPQCTLTATLQVGTIALCSSCHSRRSSVGKGQPAVPLPAGPPLGVLVWIGTAQQTFYEAERTLSAAVTRAPAAGHYTAGLLPMLCRMPAIRPVLVVFGVAVRCGYGPATEHP